MEIINWLIDLLARNFIVYKVNEYKTSIINCRTFEENKHMMIKIDQFILFLHTPAIMVELDILTEISMRVLIYYILSLIG